MGVTAGSAEECAAVMLILRQDLDEKLRKWLTSKITALIKYCDSDSPRNHCYQDEKDFEKYCRPHKKNWWDGKKNQYVEYLAGYENIAAAEDLWTKWSYCSSYGGRFHVTVREFSMSEELEPNPNFVWEWTQKPDKKLEVPYDDISLHDELLKQLKEIEDSYQARLKQLKEVEDSYQARLDCWTPEDQCHPEQDNFCGFDRYQRCLQKKYWEARLKEVNEHEARLKEVNRSIIAVRSEQCASPPQSLTRAKSCNQSNCSRQVKFNQSRSWAYALSWAYPKRNVWSGTRYRTPWINSLLAEGLLITNYY